MRIQKASQYFAALTSFRDLIGRSTFQTEPLESVTVRQMAPESVCRSFDCAYSAPLGVTDIESLGKYLFGLDVSCGSD